MAALIAGEKARMYALGNVARGGATRGGYHSPKVFVAINGVQYATGRAAGFAQVDVGSLSIRDVRGNTANTCSFTCRGFTPAVGQSIVITLGSINSLTREFGGLILSMDAGYVGSAANTVYTVRGIDPSWLENPVLVSGRWVSTSASVIAAALVPLGYTGKNIQAGLPAIDTFSYTNQSVESVLAQLIARFGGTGFVDYLNDLHCFLNADPAMPTDPTPLTATHPTLLAFLATSDLSQIATRCFVEGGGLTCLAAIGPGETLVPLADLTWYPLTGGLVAAPNQRLAYSGVIPAGDGALVGPGVAPAVPPMVLQGPGAGLSAGLYTYAYTFVTASGETLPSPLASVTTGGLAPSPAVAPIYVSNPGGGSMPAGYFGWAYSYVDASGETLVSPVMVNGAFAAGGSVHLTVPIGPSYVTSRKLYRTKTQVSALAASTATLFGYPGDVQLANNTTTAFVDSYADASLGGAPPVTNTAGTCAQVALWAIALGPVGTTARKIYRTAVNVTQLQLQQTIANNTATVGVTDATADGSLGANAPTSDTSLLPQPAGQVLIGASTILCSSAQGASTSGGWALLPGQPLVRYTGITGNTLTGIPTSGPGSVLAPIAYNATIGFPPCLIVPASGTGAILFSIYVGDPINVLVQVDDFAAQAALSALVDPTNVYGGARGIRETSLSDGTIGAVEALARGNAELALRKLVDVHITYTVQDCNTRAGRTIAVVLPLQGVPGSSFKISQVTQSGHTPALLPISTVQAGARFSFEQLVQGFGG